MIVKQYSHNECYLESHGLKSMPFPVEDLNENKELFDILINIPVVGTVQ